MTSKGKYDNPFRATLKGISDLYGKKKDGVDLPANIDLNGKTVLITGSSSGLGYAVARRIAAARAKVIMVVRSGIPEKGEAIKKVTGNDKVQMYHVDLLDFKSIRQLIKQLEKDGIRIDIMISNAAMVPLKSRQTPQGLEEMFMVNYLAPFYLMNELIHRKLIVPGRSMVIIVSSESHRNPKKFDWEEFGVYRDYGINETVARYGYFKLLLTTFACELSRRHTHGKETIPVRVLCPGPVNSNIAREAPAWMQPILKLAFSAFFRSPEKASDPVIYFATDNSDAANIPLDYLFLMQRKAIDEKATDLENGQRLWDLSERLIKELGY